MFEDLLMSRKKTQEMAYKQLVPNVISSASLASAIGLTNGIDFNPNVAWIEYDYKGAKCLSPMRPIRHTLTWRHIYTAGAVYGDDVSTAPVTGPVSRRVQNARVTIADKTYRVRLMTGAETNPYAGVVGSDPPWNAAGDCEFNALIYPIVSDAALTGKYLGPKLASPYTLAQLGITGVGQMTICQNVHKTADNNAVVARGNSTRSTAINSDTFGTGSGGNAEGWRPVLELIE